MQRDFLKFLKAIIVFSFIVAALIGFAEITFWEDEIDLLTWMVLLYFIVTTILFHVGLQRSAQGKPQSFVRYYMGATTLKLFVHVIVLLLYSLFNRDEAVQFIITFLIFYVLYTAFEVVYSAKRFGR